MLFIQQCTRAVDTVRASAATPAGPVSFLVGMESPGAKKEMKLFIFMYCAPPEKGAAWESPHAARVVPQDYVRILGHALRRDRHADLLEEPDGTRV